MDSPSHLGLWIMVRSHVPGSLSPGTPVQYEVTGLPVDQKAWIGRRTDNHWHLFRERSGIQGGEWRGKFETVERALQALVEEIADD